MRKTRGGWGETGRAGLNFTFNKFPLRTLSESLAQANITLAIWVRVTVDLIQVGL